MTPFVIPIALASLFLIAIALLYWYSRRQSTPIGAVIDKELGELTVKRTGWETKSPCALGVMRINVRGDGAALSDSQRQTLVLVRENSDVIRAAALAAARECAMNGNIEANGGDLKIRSIALGDEAASYEVWVESDEVPDGIVVEFDGVEVVQAEQFH